MAMVIGATWIVDPFARVAARVTFITVRVGVSNMDSGTERERDRSQSHLIAYNESVAYSLL